MTIAIENLKALIGQISDSALGPVAKHGGQRAMYPNCRSEVISNLVPIVGSLTAADVWFLEKAMKAYEDLFHSADDCPEVTFPRYALLEFVATGGACNKADALARALYLRDTLADDLGTDERETRAARWLAYDMAAIIKGEKFHGDTFGEWAARAVGLAREAAQ